MNRFSIEEDERNQNDEEFKNDQKSFNSRMEGLSDNQEQVDDISGKLSMQMSDISQYLMKGQTMQDEQRRTDSFTNMNGPNGGPMTFGNLMSMAYMRNNSNSELSNKIYGTKNPSVGA